MLHRPSPVPLLPSPLAAEGSSCREPVTVLDPSLVADYVLGVKGFEDRVNPISYPHLCPSPYVLQLEYPAFGGQDLDMRTSKLKKKLYYRQVEYQVLYQKQQHLCSTSGSNAEILNR